MLTVANRPHLMEDHIEVGQLAVQVAADGDLLGQRGTRVPDVALGLEQPPHLQQQFQRVARVQRLLRRVVVEQLCMGRC